MQLGVRYLPWPPPIREILTSISSSTPNRSEVKNIDNIMPFIDRIINLDTHNDMLLDRMSEPCGRKDYYYDYLSTTWFMAFVYGIFDKVRVRAGTIAGSILDREHEEALVRGRHKLTLITINNKDNKNREDLT